MGFSEDNMQKAIWQFNKRRIHYAVVMQFMNSESMMRYF